jgi:hypothetical protein
MAIRLKMCLPPSLQDTVVLLGATKTALKNPFAYQNCGQISGNHQETVLILNSIPCQSGLRRKTNCSV